LTWTHMPCTCMHGSTYRYLVAHKLGDDILSAKFRVHALENNQHGWRSRTNWSHGFALGAGLGIWYRPWYRYSVRSWHGMTYYLWRIPLPSRGLTDEQILTTWVLRRYNNELQTSEMFSTAGRTVKSGLVASAVVSSWTWAATLLQSSSVAFRYGMPLIYP
jgi:hypothetical protein